MPNGTVHSGYTDATQATARLVICKQDTKERLWKGTFPTKVYRVAPNISVGPNGNGPFHLISNRHFREFCAKWKAPKRTCYDVRIVPLGVSNKRALRLKQTSFHGHMFYSNLTETVTAVTSSC